MDMVAVSCENRTKRDEDRVESFSMLKQVVHVEPLNFEEFASSKVTKLFLLLKPCILCEVR
jgi:hypothetical protein